MESGNQEESKTKMSNERNDIKQSRDPVFYVSLYLRRPRGLMGEAMISSGRKRFAMPLGAWFAAGRRGLRR